MYSKCTCCTVLMEKRALPDTKGFLNILNNIKKSFTIKNGDVEIEKNEVRFRMFNRPGMGLDARIYVIEVLAVMDYPYAVCIYAYSHDARPIIYVRSPDITRLTKTLNCYSNVITDIKSEELTSIKIFINANLVL